MKLKVINIEGKKSDDIELSDKIFSLTPNKYVIQSLVDWQMNHFKARTAKTKQRNEIKGSTAKTKTVDKKTSAPNKKETSAAKVEKKEVKK